ncbi:MAG: xanthine dehydrogenase family protein [Sphaerochaetaceae bacterium]|nr:xanthine dehydrogenase family protein [Sphaerochaetaceae bacterium]
MTTIIGKSIERTDAPSKVRGKALYSGDYYAKDMVHCVLVRSSVAHGTIKTITIPSLPKGTYFYSAKDLKNNTIPSICNDQLIFATDHVRYLGEPIAIVASPTLKEAQEFASKVKVEIETLPVLDDYEKALDDSAPLLYEKGNLCSQFHSEKGNVEEVFSKAFIVLEESFHMPIQCHGFLEPEASFAYSDENGVLNLICSTQNVYVDKNLACHALGLSPEKVNVRSGVVGGGFGGKDANTTQVYVAIASYLSGHPARLVFSREENIRFGLKRHQGLVKAKVAFSQEGRIEAFQGYMCLDTGAYALLGPAVLGLGMEHMTGPYFIPNVKLDGHLVYTNHAPASAMRGFGAPQSTIAIETFLNKVASKLGIDSLEIRKINGIHKGQEGSMGGVMEHCTDFNKALQLFEQSSFYREMKSNKDSSIGYGLSCGIMSSGMGKGVPDTCFCKIKYLGNNEYEVSTSLVDIGQGSETALGMIASEALRVPFNNIHMVMGVTEGQQDSGSTAASRSTFVAGNAILDAVEKLKNTKVQEGTVVEGVCRFPEASGNAVHTYFAFMVLGVKLKVNPLTGKIDLLKIHNVTETGNVINPTMLAGQVFGGITMTQGYTLTEQVRYKDGISFENGFSNYLLPTALDVPSMSNDNVPSYEETGPFGAKGVAECSTVALAPAVIAAVNCLVPEANITSLPIDPLLLVRRS